MGDPREIDLRQHIARSDLDILPGTKRKHTEAAGLEHPDLANAAAAMRRR